MKTPLYLFMFVIFSSLALANTIDGWFHLNDTINYTGQSILVKPVNLAGRVILTIDGKDLPLYNDGTCSQLDSTKYCLDEIEDEGIGSDNRKIRRYHLIIKETEGLLSLGHSTSKNKLKIGEISTIDLIISNSGERKINETTFELKIPEGLLIENVIGCSREGNSIIWKGEVPAGKEITCKYLLKAAAPGDYSLIGNAYWHNNGEKLEETTNKITIEALDLELVPKITYDSLRLGKESELTIEIKNSVSDTVKLLTYIDPPEGIETDQISYRYNNDLEGKKKVTYNITAKPVRSGNHSFNVRLVYDYGALKRDYVRQLTVTVPTPDVDIEHDASYKLKSGERGIIDIFMINSEDDPMRDVIVNLTSGLVTASQSTDMIEKNSRKAILSVPFESPAVDASTTYSVTAYISYKNKFGELFRTEDKLTIQVEKVVIEGQPVKEGPVVTEPVINASEINSSVIQQPVVQENMIEKKPFWKKFIDWFFGLF